MSCGVFISEEAYWRDQYAREPYYELGLMYDDYAAAYRIGYQARVSNIEDSFEEHEIQFEVMYNRVRGAARLNWPTARLAVRAAWAHAVEALMSVDTA